MLLCLSERHWFRNVVTKNELATFLVANVYLNIDIFKKYEVL
jgi:hypothetical protein